MDRRKRNTDFRHRANFPAPAVEEIEESLMKCLTPAIFAPLRMPEGSKQQMRARILTLPVMVAIVVILVWRQLPSLMEVLRVLAREGLLWLNPIEVSKQALSKRLDVIPASLFGQVYNEAINVIRKNRGTKELAKEWQAFSAIWIADGSTLEALKNKLVKSKEEKAEDKEIKEQAERDKSKELSNKLGGKIMMVVEALTHLPVTTFYTNESQANDKTFCDQLIEALPVAGLLIFDLGFFSFSFFDAFTEAKKYFVTRLREKTAYEVVKVLSCGKYYKDEIINLGLYRSNPCKHQVRLVSVLWGQTWYYYLTNALDDKALPARQVCDLYRRRWRIEDAFLLTKRLLGLSYLWVSSTNGVEIQVYATWVFYAVLIDLCNQVADVLHQPLEKISVEMVFRSLYHFSRALARNKNIILVNFIALNAKLFGIIKATLKSHKDKVLQLNLIWAEA